jgi:hypothetical protein
LKFHNGNDRGLIIRIIGDANAPAGCAAPDASLELLVQMAVPFVEPDRARNKFLFRSENKKPSATRVSALKFHNGNDRGLIIRIFGCELPCGLRRS